MNILFQKTPHPAPHLPISLSNAVAITIEMSIFIPLQVYDLVIIIEVFYHCSCDYIEI